MDGQNITLSHKIIFSKHFGFFTGSDTKMNGKVAKMPFSTEFLKDRFLIKTEGFAVKLDCNPVIDKFMSFF